MHGAWAVIFLSSLQERGICPWFACGFCREHREDEDGCEARLCPDPDRSFAVRGFGRMSAWSSACLYACVRTMAVPGCLWVQGVGLQGAAALHEGQRWLSVNEDTPTKQCKCKALSWAERIAFVCFSFSFVLRSSLPDHFTFAFARPGVRQSGRQVPESA